MIFRTKKKKKNEEEGAENAVPDWNLKDSFKKNIPGHIWAAIDANFFLPHFLRVEKVKTSAIYSNKILAFVSELDSARHIVS